MKRVSGYQTTDGKLFPYEQKAEARNHQKALNIVAGLVQIGDRIGDETILDRDSYGNPIILDGENFARFVMQHAADIKLALDGKYLAPPANDDDSVDAETHDD